MSSPKLSIVIPAFNAEAGIVKTLASIRAPEIFSYEVIVVDDGSVDSTAAIVSEIATKEPWLRLIRKKNAGVSAARNDGLASAKGEYVMFVDADDALLDDALFRVGAYLRDFSESDVLSFGMRFSRYNGDCALQSSDRLVSRTRSIDTNGLELAIDELLGENYLQSACSKVFCVRFLKSKALHFDERLNSFEDFDFVLSCLECGARLSVVAEPIYEYRLGRGESGSRTARGDMDQQMRLVRNRIKGFCACTGVDEHHFDSVSAHLFVNAVNSLIVSENSMHSFVARVEALRDSQEFSDLFSTSIDYPNRYSRLIFSAARHDCWNFVAFLSRVRNAIRRKTRQPV